LLAEGEEMAALMFGGARAGGSMLVDMVIRG